MNSSLRDAKLFLSMWIKNPLSIAAPIPSSASLAQLMARQVSLGERGPVIELGSGTGVVTNALLNHGICPEDLIVIERDPTLYQLLVNRYPYVRIIHGDALEVREILENLGIRAVRAVVSSLPLLTFPVFSQLAVLRQCAHLLGPHNPFVQFTYSPFSPVRRRLLGNVGLVGSSAGRVWNNVPPATVWRYSRSIA